MHPDEGPLKGGDYGPYRQSERRDYYWGFVEKLIDSGHAYYAFDTPQELEEMRTRMKASSGAVPSRKFSYTLFSVPFSPLKRSQRNLAPFFL